MLGFETKLIMPVLKDPKSPEWSISASKFALNTSNPVRAIVDTMKISPNPEKSLITLALGDPTITPYFFAHPTCTEAVKNLLSSGSANGYGPSSGILEARKSVSMYFNQTLPSSAPKISTSDVIMTSGCCGALEISIGALGEPGKSILVPRPGFSIYKTIADSKGIKTQFYDLNVTNF